ncbi:glycoside hydrolase [Guyanagaster necrorhizus]|uniref:Glycoside hydrolase n=1 Tax=Guyanagaster necrorhizus TaxID=856835 RepID=A0A9P7VXU0_9AGAR|nr:glycoside hydrolase [Guyanagaster necrorhizus MCA 3950]KAG7448583.1 glycoside hydrolase [Guyanagaster necrorhizus MCA 3950]
MRQAFAVPLLLSTTVFCQQIWDIWQTTWDRSKLFTSLALSTPINFQSPGSIGSADIVVNDTSTYQSVWGFGGSLTDSSALILNNLKSTNSTNYWTLMKYLFDATDGANAAGLNYIRVPLGASDFSASQYSFDDSSGDTSFAKFNIDAAPSYLFSVLKDIISINSLVKVHVLPWSPPGWMKDSGTMNGGTLNSTLVTKYATYLLKCLQGFQSKGLPVYAISIQNEPENNLNASPTATLPAVTEGRIGTALRALMDNFGFEAVKLIGWDHNWDGAGGYAIDLMEAAGDAFDGVAFHCYAGNVTEQDTFHTQYPDKEIYFTECTGSLGSDWWSDIKWYMDNIFIGAIEHNSHSGLMWNIALDGNGEPRYPGTTSCSEGCRAIVQVNSDGTYSVNQEFYAMAQASKAIVPKDKGGPFGKRVKVSVGGDLSWTLRVGAYVTGRASSSDWLRYSLVVLNWYDHPNGSWSPQPVKTTIEFRGMQAQYTFPVGVTTLWWYGMCDVATLAPLSEDTVY